MSPTSHHSINNRNILIYLKLRFDITSRMRIEKLLVLFNDSFTFIQNAKIVACAIGGSALLQIQKIGLSAKKYVTSAMKYFPCKEILTKKVVTKQINVTYQFAYMQTLTRRVSADQKYVTSAMKYFPCVQILKRKGVTEQINVISQFADNLQTLTLRGSADQINVIFEYYVNMQTPTRAGLADLTSLICGCVIIQMYGEELKLTSSSACKERSKYLSAIIVLYRNIIRNETDRMMKSIDMVASEAKYLFGDERSCIFLLLLNDGLLKFESPVLAANFVPNMADSTVRKHVISFFEYVIDMMNRQMTLLLSCPDKERLQEMPEPNLISLLQTLINSSLKPKIKGEKQLSLKESTFILVDSEEFQKALEEENREIVLNRHRHGDEKVVNRFVDERLEITRASARRENRRCHSIYFPTDCRLFIYIPTEYGSYWYLNDMKRANKTSRNGK